MRLPNTFPKAAQELFDITLKKSGKEAVAWAVVKKRFKKQDNGVWVARSDAFKQTEYFVFDAKPAEEFVERTESGHVVQNYVLSDLFPDSYGTKPNESMLNKWAAWLNENKPEVDVDHEMFRQMKKSHGGNTTMVERAMRFKRGIAKTMKAWVDKGKLIVSIMFDKRYEKYVEKVKGLSIEAAMTVDKLTNEWQDGKLFGYSLMVNEEPSIGVRSLAV